MAAQIDIEEAELQQALANSLILSRQYSEDQRNYLRAIENSLIENIPDVVPVPAEEILEETFTIPKNDFRVLLGTNRHYLQRTLGVKYQLRPPGRGEDDAESVVTVRGSNVDAVTIAKLRIQEIATNPADFLAEIAVLRQQQVHVFVDNSNIFLGSQYVIDPVTRRPVRDCSTYLNMAMLASTVEGGRTVRERVVFGSEPPRNNVVWQKWRDAHYNLHLARRPEGMGEQFVDDALISMIQKSILDRPSDPANPRTLVLLTGDGNPNHGRASFPGAVMHALEHGWRVELWTWRQSMNKIYKEYEKNFGGALDCFRIRYLDEYRDDVTFRRKIGGGGGAVPPAGVPGGGAGGAAAEEKKAEVIAEVDDEDWMNCPISLMPMEDPVFLRINGRELYFDRMYVEEWIQVHHQCPLTRTPVEVRDLQPASAQFRARLQAALGR